MSNKAHFFDIETLFNIDSKAWIVSKETPNIPIMKIPKADFNLIRSGIYRKQNNKIEFNGKTYWLPTNLIQKLKIKAKNNKVDFSNLAISLQEFLNADIIDEMDFDLNLDTILRLKNTEDSIYIILSKQTKKNYQNVVDKIREELRKNGLLIKNFYFISENLWTLDDDAIKFKKMRLLLQHLVGYKTNGDSFIDEEITKYDEINYYSNDPYTLNISKEINNLFGIILNKTKNSGLTDVIKEDIRELRPSLIVNKINENEYNRIQSEKVLLALPTLIKTFESFKKYWN